MTPITLDQIQVFLRRIQRETGQYAVVAGGSVRDTMLGRPVKDIDLFIAGSPREEKFVEFLRSYGNLWRVGDSNKEPIPCVLISEGSEDYESSLGVYTSAVHFYGHPIQIINYSEGWDSAFAMIEDNFDFGICQCWVSPDRVGALPAFRKDIANKTITWVKGTRPLEDRERRHLERIQAKYPGWKVRRVQWKQELEIS